MPHLINKIKICILRYLPIKSRGDSGKWSDIVSIQWRLPLHYLAIDHQFKL